jgi:hypothetical protein
MKKILSLLVVFVLLFGAVPTARAASFDSAPVPNPVLPSDSVVNVGSSNPNITYSGGWSHEWCNLCIGNYQAFTNVVNSYWQYTFTGNHVGFYSNQYSNRGTVDVYIDDVLVGDEVDLYIETFVQPTVVFETDVTNGTHTIKVVTTGNKNPSSSDVYHSFDSLFYIKPLVDDANFKCVDVYPTNSCPDFDPHPGPYTQSSSSGDQSRVTVAIDCPAENPGCKNDYDVYYLMTWDYAWNAVHNSTVTVYEQIGSRSPSVQVAYPCGSGTGGSCSGVTEGVISAANVGTLFGGVTQNGTDQGYNFVSHVTITFSLFPISTCGEEYLSLTTDTFIIDPLIETPVGQPTDGQMYQTVENEVYKISISNQWNDGSTDRQDAAISWDGLTWAALDSFPAVCISQSATGGVSDYYITAESGTFYIRANDAPGAFANNVQGSPAFSYTIDLTSTATSTAPCESQYAFDEFADVVGFTGVPATSEAGVLGNNDSALVVGEWYVIKWAYGYWQDEGSPPDRTDLEYMMDNGWQDLSGGGGSAVWCESASGLEVLFQARSESIMLRVNNQTGTFSANTGTPYYTLYHSTFTRTPASCETSIQIGDLIEHKTVQGNQGNGDVFAFMVGGSTGYLNAGLTPGAWYVLETTDGPWWNAVLSATPTYDYGMAVAEGQAGSIGTWGPLENWTTAVCNVPIDTLGHRRVIFQMPAAGDLEWRLRVNDVGSFVTNQGSMSWDLYGATQYQVDPETGACDYSYDLNNVVDAGEVMANNEQGAPLDGLVAGELYAIKIVGTGYGWKESLLSSTTLYDTELSHNGGSEFYGPLPEGYPAGLCAETDGNDVTVYVRPGQNYNYRLRVKSDSYNNNTGKMGYAVYGATAGPSVENTCLNGWSLQAIDEFTWIDVRSEPGQILTTDNQRYEEFISLVPGRTYVVETPAGQGPWIDASGGASKWTTALSKDNGTTWNELGYDNPDIDCAVNNAIGHVWKARFTVQEGDLWKIRVNDTAGAFSDNGGNMAFKFYVLCEGMSCTGSLPNDSDNIPAISIQGGGNVCSMAVVRPGPLSLSEISSLGSYFGSWIQYANLSVLRYMAWCDKHTNMLTTFINSLGQREPFATINEWETNLTRVRQQIESYNWGSNAYENTSIFDQMDDGELQQWIYDHFFAQGDAIWNGGNLVSFGDGSLPESYDACTNSFTAILPSRLKPPICFVSSWFIESQASFWMQIIIDLMALVLLYETIKGALQDAIYMITGVKPWVKSTNRANWVTIDNYNGGAPTAPTTTGDQVAEELSKMLGGSYDRNADGSYRRTR